MKGDYSNEFHFLNAKPFPVVKQSWKRKPSGKPLIKFLSRWKNKYCSPINWCSAVAKYIKYIEITQRFDQPLVLNYPSHYLFLLFSFLICLFIFVDINVIVLALFFMKMKKQQEAVFWIVLFFIISILFCLMSFASL